MKRCGSGPAPRTGIPRRHRREAIWLAAGLLLPAVALASFGGGGPCRDFACYYLFFGLVLGVSGGIPLSAAVFIGLHLFFRHPERSKARQILLGGFIGILAFALCAASASHVALWAGTPTPQNERYPLIGFLVPYILLALASVLYVRTAPRHA